MFGKHWKFPKQTISILINAIRNGLITFLVIIIAINTAYKLIFLLSATFGIYIFAFIDFAFLGILFAFSTRS